MQQPEERQARATQAYLVATTLGILCIVPRPFLDSAFGAQVSILLVMPAVVVAGWWGGAGPAAVTAVLSVGGTVGFYLARGGSLLDAGAAGTLIFILMSMTWLCWFGAQLHRLRLRSLDEQAAAPDALDAAQVPAESTVFELNQQLRAEQARFDAVRRTHEAVIAKLGHELRTPLNTILGWAHLLDADPASTPAVRHAAEVIARNARHQAGLIDRLFDFHGVLNGSVAVDIQPVDPAQVAAEAMQAVAQRAADKQVSVSNAMPQGLQVLADAQRLRQMVEQLLDNAVKFTPAGGNVRLSGDAREQALVISVEDSGEGIAPEFVPQVFERFRQADDSATRLHGGLGLGLTVVKALAELQQGQVRAFSEGSGRGARFEIELPMPEAAEAPAALAPGEAGGGWSQALAGQRVLVVDDEADGRELVCEILTRHGAHVDVAADAEAALRCRAHAHYDLLVSDVAMPGMNGYELLRQWRQRDGSGPRRAIALTAFAGAQARQLAQEAGYDCLLNKPVEPGELVRAACAPQAADPRATARGAVWAGKGRTVLQ
jgi:signal transduction histidine kinase/CheY-like chemotaxis protein